MSRVVIVFALLVSLLNSCNSFVATRLPICRMVRLNAEEGAAATPPPAAADGIKALLQADMKAAMKAKDKEKLAGVRY
jgi:hypothetical protein